MTSPASSARSHASFWYRAFAVTAAGAVYLGLPHIPLVADEGLLRGVVNTIAGSDATLLGFLISAGALLYAVANTRLVQNLMRTGHFNKVVGELFVAAGAFLVAVALGFACGLAPTQTSDGTQAFQVLMRLVVAANACAFLLLVPPARGLWVLLTSLEPEGGTALR
ncbi:hypothetical protein [Aquabacterium sp.]|uniref:hypothetical protein n=1 Tax=Aquabacterium sp. TaxID=1872578 RepID=UPI003783B2E3